MTADEHFDAIIIGSGQAANPLARALAESGRKTAIIEREHVGGTCINEGCTPTKTMVASARAAYLARRAADYGVHTGSISVDMAVVRQRKRAIVDDFRGGNERRLKTTKGLELIEGEAHFTDPHTIEVNLNSGGMRQLHGDSIFLNTGARPTPASVPGSDSIHYLNSTSIMELETLPDHLLILGGGYIGLEFGQMFRRFGSKVTVVQRSEQLLGREDADIAEEVAKILREDGLELLFNTSAKSVKKTSTGIQLAVQTPEGEREIVGSHLLIAIGRTPNTERLNLEAAGVKTDKRGFIPVNETLQTNVPHIYALGDVNGGPAFTHISYDDFRIIRDNLINGKHVSAKDRMVPYTVFMDPQLGRIGLTEQQAREQGLNIKVAKMPMNYVARALEVDESRGIMKAIVEAETEQILGCAFLGMEGGELMAMVQIAMMGKVRYSTLREGIFAHPTLAESLNNLFASFE